MGDTSADRRARAIRDPLPIPERKICSKCKVEKSASRFRKDTTRRNGLYPQCSSCQEVPTPEQKARWNRASLLRSKYGITINQWDDMFQSQGSCCGLCGVTSPGTKHGWQTDHDHQTGVVRGILCLSCNLHVGRLEKGWLPPNPDTLDRYLNPGSMQA